MNDQLISSDSDSLVKGEMLKSTVKTMSTTTTTDATTHKLDDIHLSANCTIPNIHPTTICNSITNSNINNNNSIQLDASSVVIHTLSTSIAKNANQLMRNGKDNDLQIASSSLPATPVAASLSFLPPNDFTIMPAVHDRPKSESIIRKIELSTLERQAITANQDSISVNGYPSMSSTTITTYPSNVVSRSTAGTTDLICSKSNFEASSHTTHPVISSIVATSTSSPITITTTTTGLTIKPTSISMSADIHPIDGDDLEVEYIDDSSLRSNQEKSYIGRSLQLIPQRKQSQQNKKRLFYRSSLSPCSDIHPSVTAASSPIVAGHEIHSKDDQRIVNNIIPSSAAIIDTEPIRNIASVACLTSLQPLALQPQFKMVSSIELSGNLVDNNAPTNDNFSTDSPFISSVKLHRRVTASTVISTVMTDSTTAPTPTTTTTLSKTATSPALISSVIIPVNATNEKKTQQSRSSMIELINCPNKNLSNSSVTSICPPIPTTTTTTTTATTSIPPPPSLTKPQGNMGACFSLVFEGCPLKINSTATWTNPANNGQVILLGTNDGIYCLQLKGLSENSLELLFPRRCLWLSVTRDTMMSLSGRHPQLYAHNLVSLMKLKSQGHSMLGSVGGGGGGGGAASKFGKFVKLFPKRFSPSKKMPDTKGCLCANVTRNPFNGAKYLCAAMTNEILIMEWFNPVSSFIEIKRIFVPDMPSPLLNFDLLIVKNLPLPLVCLGVYRHHSRKGREGQRFRLHLIDLNSSGPNPPQMPPVTSSIPLPISMSSMMTAVTSSTTTTTVNTTTTITTTISSSTAAVTSTSLSPNHSDLPVGSSISSTHSKNIRELNNSIELSNSDHHKLTNTNKTHLIPKSDQTKAELQRKNTLFLPEDILPVVETVQLEHNTILICFLDCAKVVSLNGQIKSSRYRATTLDFNGITVESIVCLRDSILVFHPHGLLGKSFTGEYIQCITTTTTTTTTAIPMNSSLLLHRILF
ncbi:unnamed protein product [Schistosoma turkestanicum]|nr:unnamed protein product [Schistosoma turkestanicum]